MRPDDPCGNGFSSRDKTLPQTLPYQWQGLLAHLVWGVAEDARHGVDEYPQRQLPVGGSQHPTGGRRHLHGAAPPARIAQARAEKIPLPWASVDVVVAGQAHHWFDEDRALPEVARVLRPGGTLAIWSMADSATLRLRLATAFVGVEAERVPVQLQGRDEAYWIISARR